ITNAKEDAIINPYVNRPTLSTRAATLNTANSAARHEAWVEEAKQLPQITCSGLRCILLSHSILRYFDEICNLQNQTRSTAVSQQHLWVILVNISTLYVYLCTRIIGFRGLRRMPILSGIQTRESFRRACNTFQLLHTGMKCLKDTGRSHYTDASITTSLAIMYLQSAI
ncbi:hypothetical protein ACHAWO_003490, partial [Cyclotella atomus]